MVSRRQPGFTLSLTFYIDGYRDARLSGCCEGARHLRTPTRIGGPRRAPVLRAAHGNATPCSVWVPPPKALACRVLRLGRVLLEGRALDV